MSHDRERRPRALFAELEIRTSERTGRPWYSAWLGRARIIGFEADEPNERGHSERPMPASWRWTSRRTRRKEPRDVASQAPEVMPP
jgi:hypothetical protein